MFDEREKKLKAAKEPQVPDNDTTADNPLSNNSQHIKPWSLEDEQREALDRSKKHAAIGLLSRLAAETNDPCYEQCIQLLGAVEAG